MIRDFNIEWLEKRIYIPASSFQSRVLTLSEGTPNTYVDFLSAGTPVFAEIGTTNLAGVSVAAADDAVSHHMMIPYDLDVTKQVRFRVWAASTGGADLETITLLYDLSARGEALVEAATALNTAIPAITFSGSGKLDATDFGVINRNTIQKDDEWIALSIACTLDNASADEINILGVEMRYTPRKTAGPRRNILGGRRLNTTYPMGVQLASGQEGL